jgi:polar amino acid transport system substrate-binding protein
MRRREFISLFAGPARPRMYIGIVVMLICAAQTLAQSCMAQAPTVSETVSPLRAELIVGTKEAPPFSMKTPDGAWIGISIDLWRRVADQLSIRYRFAEETNVQDLIDGVAAGKFDVAVAALTMTAARERVVDFTEPFYATGLGIAVRSGGEASWVPIVRTMTSFSFMQAVVALAGLAVITGLVIWIVERRHNEHFSGGITKGLSTGVWWSTVAMTQRHAGEFSPRTLPGRIVGILWMIGSIVAIAIFTASITSVLTIRHLQGDVHEVSDLSSVRVAAVVGTSTEETFARLQIKYQKFDTPADALKALHAHAIDAFVYDKPLLAWIIRQSYPSSIELVDTTFDPQDYGFVLPNNSSLRKTLNVAILDTLRTDWWKQITFQYLGSR